MKLLTVAQAEHNLSRAKKAVLVAESALHNARHMLIDAEIELRLAELRDAETAKAPEALQSVEVHS